MPKGTVCGVSYYDDTLGDSVPVEKAFICGCGRGVLILTKPHNILRIPGEDMKFYRSDSEKISKVGEKAPSERFI